MQYVYLSIYLSMKERMRKTLEFCPDGRLARDILLEVQATNDKHINSYISLSLYLSLSLSIYLYISLSLYIYIYTITHIHTL